MCAVGAFCNVTHRFLTWKLGKQQQTFNCMVECFLLIKQLDHRKDVVLAQKEQERVVLKILGDLVACIIVRCQTSNARMLMVIEH